MTSLIKTIAKNFALLNEEGQAAVNTLIEIVLGAQSAKSVVRTKKRGLENASSELPDDEIAPKGSRKNNDKTESRGRGRPRKEAEPEVTESRGRGRPRKEEVAAKKPAKETKPAAKVSTPAKAAPVNGSIYDTLKLTGKKDQRAAELAAHIKRVEKFVSNDMTWQEAKTYAEKKKVEIAFGRGKPSNDLNKRKIAIALINAGVKV